MDPAIPKVFAVGRSGKFMIRAFRVESLMENRLARVAVVFNKVEMKYYLSDINSSSSD